MESNPIASEKEDYENLLDFIKNNGSRSNLKQFYNLPLNIIINDNAV